MKIPYLVKKEGGMTHVFDPIFGKNFWGGIGITWPSFVKLSRKRLSLDVPEDRVGADGRFLVLETTSSSPSEEIALLWSSDKSTSLAHECFHATHWALQGVGLKLSDESEELYAYYQQYLFRAFLGEIKF